MSGKALLHRGRKAVESWSPWNMVHDQSASAMPCRQAAEDVFWVLP